MRRSAAAALDAAALSAGRGVGLDLPRFLPRHALLLLRSSPLSISSSLLSHCQQFEHPGGNDVIVGDPRRRTAVNPKPYSAPRRRFASGAAAALPPAAMQFATG